MPGFVKKKKQLLSVQEEAKRHRVSNFREHTAKRDESKNPHKLAHGSKRYQEKLEEEEEEKEGSSSSSRGERKRLNETEFLESLKYIDHRRERNKVVLREDK